MYGNHSSHPSGFQSPEMSTGGYSYFPPHHHHHLHHLSQTETGYSHSTTNNALISAPTTTSSNNSSSTTTSSYTHPHLFSPSALEYGITTTSTSNNSPNDAYYDNDSGHSYYNSTSGPSPNAIQDHHIISTDNGMSYTNLDYTMYNQHNSSGYLPDDKSTISHYSIGDEMILSSGQPNQNTPSNWHHHHSGYLDSSISMSLTGLNAQNQMGHAVVNSAQSSSPGIQHQNQQQQHQQQQQQNLQQTYKWMQVKRNVPKPQGKCIQFYNVWKPFSSVTIECTL